MPCTHRLATEAQKAVEGIFREQVQPRLRAPMVPTKAGDVVAAAFEGLGSIRV